MRKVVAIVMGVVVAASCVPWLRHQHFFSVAVGVTTVALAAFMVFGAARTLSVWLKQKPQEAGSAQSGRWSQNFRNQLLGAAFVLMLMFTVPHFMATTSGAYKLAVVTAHQSPRFREALGVPVKEAWFSEGKEEWGNPARAEMLISVRGRVRRGNLKALAVKDDGRWRLTELTLELTQPDERINLLSNAGRPDSGEGRP